MKGRIIQYLLKTKLFAILLTPVMDKDALNARSNERFLDIRFIKNAE
jgi:hypothetical protein